MDEPAKPKCWRCGSVDVDVQFNGYVPLYHKKSECSCTSSPCSEAPSGKLSCRACGLAWEELDISEYRLVQ